VFFEDDQRRFGMTPLAECLRSDVPWSQRWLALMSGAEHYRAFSELLYSVRTGKPAFERMFGLPVFDYLSKNPEQAKTFDRAMVGVHGHETQAMIDAFDLSGVRVLADIGGGNGSLLIAVLQRYPNLKGILFDLQGVIGRAMSNIDAAGLT